MIEWWGPVINEYYGATETGVVVWHGSEEALRKPGTVGRPVPGAHPAHRRRAGPRRGAGRGRRDLPARTASVGLHLQQRRRQAPRGGAGRPRDRGRHRLPRCRRLPVPVRSQARHDHLGRRQHLPGRDRIGADPDAGRARLRGVRHPRRGVRRADLRLCRAHGRRRPRCGQVRAWLAEHVARYKVPKVVEFGAALPREDSGKIFKRKLRAPYWEKAGRSI